MKREFTVVMAKRLYRSGEKTKAVNVKARTEAEAVKKVAFGFSDEWLVKTVLTKDRNSVFVDNKPKHPGL